MSNLPEMKKSTQPQLFSWTTTRVGAVELFPAVWSAAEAITSPEVEIRLDGLTRLTELNAVYLSPLVAYLVATRLVDPDLTVRAKVIQMLGDFLRPQLIDQDVPEEVYLHVSAYLSQIRGRQVLFILQAYEYDRKIERQVVATLKECSQAGEYLAAILSDRQAPLEIRKLAAYLIGEIGYLDAISSLEKLISRLEARAEGQQWLPFYLREESEDYQLLPDVRKTLTILQTP